MLSNDELPEFFYEFDEDAEQTSGIDDGFEMPPLTARAVAVRREFFRKRNAHKAPMPALVEKFDVKRNRDAPRLHFGVPVTHDQYLQFALNHKLVEPRTDDDPVTFFDCGAAITRYLRREAGISVYMGLVYSFDHDIVLVALYDNHTMEKRRTSEREEKRIIEIIQQEFGVTNEPMWYFSS